MDFIEIEKAFEKYEFERIEKVIPKIKKHIVEKAALQDLNISDDCIRVLGRHANFLAISFVRVPKDFRSILSSIDVWECGGVDYFIDRELESYFSYCC